MIQLLHLPSEIIFAVLHRLGYEFFAEDVGRLAICRRWLAVALEVLRDLRLTSPRLRLPCASAILAHAQPVLFSLNLDLEGGDDVENSRIAYYILHRHLERPCPTLRRLRIKLGESWDFPPMLRAIHSLVLSARDLTTLDIDTSIFQPPSYSPDPKALRHNAQHFKYHLCEALNRLMLTSLRTLRCKMHFMCLELLEIPPGHSGGLTNLQEVVVEILGIEMETCPRRLSRVDGQVTMGVIQEQALTLVQQMQRPVMVKLRARGQLISEAKVGGIHAFDAIANQRGAEGWCEDSPAHTPISLGEEVGSSEEEEDEEADSDAASGSSDGEE